MQRSATPENAWRPVFLDVLRDTGNIRLAASRCGIDRMTAYRHRDKDEAFRRQWDDALEDACDIMEAEARRRAVNGCRKPIYHNGKVVGEEIEYSDTLLIFLLKAHRPEKYRERHDITSQGKAIGEVRIIQLPDNGRGDRYTGTSEEPPVDATVLEDWAPPALNEGEPSDDAGTDPGAY